MSRNATLAAAFLANVIGWGDLHAQPAQPTSEKQLLIAVVQDLRVRFEGFRDSPGARRNGEVFQLAIDRLRWFSKAADVWQPRDAAEGKALRQSLQLMLRAIRRSTHRSRPDMDLILAVNEDLGIKRDHCRLRGLSAEQKVAVKTKRRGLEEVRGLEVWYLEKFLASDPTAAPHRFREFSSPANESMAPGRYAFWARDAASGKRGTRVEQRVGAGQASLLARSGATIEIEVLAP